VADIGIIIIIIIISFLFFSGDVERISYGKVCCIMISQFNIVGVNLMYIGPCVIVIVEE